VLILKKLTQLQISIGVEAWISLLALILWALADHLYMAKIIGFYDRTFWTITALSAIPLLILSINHLLTAAKKLEYVGFFRRLGTIFLSGLLLNSTLISGVKAAQIYANRQPAGNITVLLNTYETGRTWNGVSVKVHDQTLLLPISQQLANELRKKGTDGYCAELQLSSSGKYYILEHHAIMICH
jgi:hypothetical protein